MKLPIVSLVVLTSVACVAMDQNGTIKFPDQSVIAKTLSEAGFSEFVEKTQIDQKLAGKTLSTYNLAGYIGTHAYAAYLASVKVVPGVQIRMSNEQERAEIRQVANILITRFQGSNN